MKLDNAKIIPKEGMLAVSFLDEDDDEDDEKSPPSPAQYGAPSEPEPVPYKGCLAVVRAVGAKVKNKAGDIVVTSKWAREGLKIDDATTLISDYDVKATLKV